MILTNTINRVYVVNIVSLAQVQGQLQMSLQIDSLEFTVICQRLKETFQCKMIRKKMTAYLAISTGFLKNPERQEGDTRM